MRENKHAVVVVVVVVVIAVGLESFSTFMDVTVINFLPYLLGTDIDDCASYPCKNNGTCIDRVNGFNCSCAAGFNGTRCETGTRDR